MKNYEFHCGDDGVVHTSGQSFVGYEKGVIATGFIRKVLAAWLLKNVPETRINLCIEVYRRYLTPLYDPLPVTLLTYDDFYVANGEIAMEIGGYLGIHAIHMANRWPQAEIHIFEPMPDNAEICSKNIELNGLADRVHVHNVGVSSSAGSIEFQRSARQGASYIEGVIPNVSVTQRVPTVSVDAFLRQSNIEHERVIFVRVQVNGAEADVLEGMKETLLNGVNRLVVTTRYNEDAKAKVLSYGKYFASLGREDNTFVMTR